MSGDTVETTVVETKGSKTGNDSKTTNGNGHEKLEEKKVAIYVTDTSVHMIAPDVIKGFKENDVYTPTVAIDELNNLKVHKDDNKAYKARMALKEISALVGNQPFSEIAVATPGGGKFMALTDYAYKLIGNHTYLSSNDCHILRAALKLQVKNPEKQVVLVSQDVGLRMAAQANGLHAEPYRNISVDLSKISDGIHQISTTASVIKRLKETPEVRIKECSVITKRKEEKFLPNEFVFMQNHTDKGLWVIDAQVNMMRSIPHQSVLGFSARDYGQEAAIHLALSHIPCVAISGPMGSGKTSAAVHAALELVRQGRYEKIVLFRSLSALGGKDVGFLPGNLLDKIEPYAEGILGEFQNVLKNNRPKHLILEPESPQGKKSTNQNQNGNGKTGKPVTVKPALSNYKRKQIEISAADEAKEKLFSDLQDIVNNKLIVDTVSLVQGKNLRNSVIIVDDAQNFDLTETIGYASRLAEGSKLIITGDPKQVADTRFLNENTTGLVHLIKGMSGDETFAHVTLKEVYRSKFVKALVKRLGC